MDPLEILRQFTTGELHFIHYLQPYRPYTIVNVERISDGLHRRTIVTIKENAETYKTVLLAKDTFTEYEEFNICVGVTMAVTVYPGKDSNGLEKCNRLCFDLTMPAIEEGSFLIMSKFPHSRWIP